MNIIHGEIENLAEFVKIIVDYFPNNKWIFRGQGELTDELVPKAGRIPYVSLKKDWDLNRLCKWCHQAVAFSKNLPESDWERMAYAQHHGLATRLLDWTLNAAAALYFATEDFATKEKHDGVEHDGVVFLLRRPRQVKEGDVMTRCKVVKMYQPRPITPRIIAQDSVFTYHPDLAKAMRSKPFKLKKGGEGKLEPDGNLLRIRVPHSLKRKLQRELRSIGVLRRSLFPDIEGLAVALNCTNSLYEK